MYTHTHTHPFSQCHYFVSEYEDDLIDLFTEKAANIEREICYDITGMCTAVIIGGVMVELVSFLAVQYTRPNIPCSICDIPQQC